MSNAKDLLGWFGKRKENLVQIGSRDYVLVILDAVTEFHNAAVAMSEGNGTEAVKAVNRLFIKESEADRFEDNLCAELSRGDLDAREREDLLHFVKKTDTIADWMKEAGAYLVMAKDTETVLPDGFWNTMVRISSEVEMEVRMLYKATEFIETDRTETLRLIDIVKDQERIVDDLHFILIKDILTSKADVTSILLARSIAEAVEHAADTCKQCADTVSIILISRGL